jgi:general secretion pathway protein C
MRKLYSTIFYLIALSVVIYLGVDLFYSFVVARLREVGTEEISLQQSPEVQHRRRPPLRDFETIMQRNIFGSVETRPEELEEREIEALEPTSLKIALLGTVTGSPQSAVAIIEESDKKTQGLYRLGDSVQNAIVRKILRGKVVLRVGDNDQILTMEESLSSRSETDHGISTVGGRGEETTIMVNLSDLQSSLTNINRLLTEARIRPHYRDGKADGLALTQVKPDSFFRTLGLQDGDIVQGIDSRAIRSPDDILSFYENLKSGSQISLQVDRRGQQRTINYRFK